MTPPDQKRTRRPQRANGAETRRRLLEVAMALFADGGYEATSLRRIAAGGGVDLATLKYHFGDKPALFAEVYRSGHDQFILHIQPLFADLARVRDHDGLRAQIRALVLGVHQFIEENTDFVRLVLYRILEDTVEISGLEDELQGLALGVLDRSLRELVDCGVIRPVDTRALLAFLIASVPMWFATCKAKPGWVGEPVPTRSDAGRVRSEAFLQDMLERMLMAEGSRS